MPDGHASVRFGTLPVGSLSAPTLLLIGGVADRVLGSDLFHPLFGPGFRFVLDLDHLGLGWSGPDRHDLWRFYRAGDGHGHGLLGGGLGSGGTGATRHQNRYQEQE